MLKEIETILIHKYRARSAYEQINYLQVPQMVALYGHGFHDFQAIRNQLDSERIFTNEYIRERLGD